jgi:hypothetical protein
MILPEHSGALALTTNTNTGRDLYRSISPPLLKRHFGIEMPSDPARPRRRPTVDLESYEGVYAWPDVCFLVRKAGSI